MIYREAVPFSLLARLLALVLAVSESTLLGYGSWRQLALGHPFGIQPLSNRQLEALTAVVIVVGWALVLAIWAGRTVVEVHAHHIQVRWPPFAPRGRAIPLSEVHVRQSTRTGLTIVDGHGRRLAVPSACPERFVAAVRAAQGRS